MPVMTWTLVIWLKIIIFHVLCGDVPLFGCYMESTRGGASYFPWSCECHFYFLWICDLAIYSLWFCDLVFLVNCERYILFPVNCDLVFNFLWNCDLPLNFCELIHEKCKTQFSARASRALFSTSFPFCKPQNEAQYILLRFN